MALNFRCDECGGSYITPDVYKGDWSKVKNPYAGRIVTGPMIRKPCTCAAKWEEEQRQERRQDNIHAIAKEVHDILAERGIEAMVAAAVAEAINNLGRYPQPPIHSPSVDW